MVLWMISFSDVLGISGIAKNSGEKSYDYVKRVLTEYKSQISSTATLQAQLANAQAEAQKLKDKLAAGAGDEALKQQLKDAKAQVTQLQTQLQTKETDFTEAKTRYENQIKDVHVDYAFQAATAGLKFKTGITENVQKILLASAKAEVLAKGTPDFIDGENGSKILVFRGADGNVLNNPANNLNPFTAEDLLMQTSIKDVVDTGKQQTGAGTSGSSQQTGGNAGHSSVLDLSGAKNQLEADKTIENYLLSSGITRDSAEFADKSLQIRNENNVSQLPLR